ncbi:MAG: hypothetical protein G01um10148_616 [Parcubacteria group bacterium Gr01-1014_8]|nr:MAG: hypothetical protein G01um10148_616 [Parcubacteria group bacterium Gr01-1014_8]
MSIDMRIVLLVVVVIAVGAGVGYYFGKLGVFEPSHDTKEVNPAIHAKKAETPANTIVGVWKSAEDAKFTREFKPDFSVIDRYEGDASATSEANWYTFMSPTDEPTPFPIREGLSYMKIMTPNEVMFFTVDRSSDDELELTYVDGETLRFKRVR